MRLCEQIDETKRQNKNEKVGLFCRRGHSRVLDCFIYVTSLTEIKLTGFDSGLFTDSIYRPEDDGKVI